MEFHYPANWTLVATGKQISRADGEDRGETNEKVGAEKVSRWTSERPIPVAGFNLGKYVRAEAKAGNTLVEAYGTKGVEKSFPKARPEVIEQPGFPGDPATRSLPPMVPDSAAPVAGARCAGGGGQGSDGHCQFLGVVWAVSV